MTASSARNFFVLKKRGILNGPPGTDDKSQTYYYKPINTQKCAGVEISKLASLHESVTD